MRSLCFLALLILSSISSFAQLYPEGATKEFSWKTKYYRPVAEQNSRCIDNVRNSVKEQKISYGGRNEHFFTYDEGGRVTAYIANQKRHAITYDNGIYKTSFSSYKNTRLSGRLIRVDSFVWDKGRLLKADTYNGKRELIERESYKYDSTYITEYRYEKKRRGKFRELDKTEYEYYSDHSNKKITHYKRGRVRQCTTFDCDPKGITRKPKRDSAYSCVKYDVDSLGNKIRVSINNTKGYSVKVVQYFDADDKMIASKTYDTKKGKLLWEYHYKPGTPYVTEFCSYKRGRKFYWFNTIYDEHNNCLSSETYKRGRLLHRNQNEYNDKGLITAVRYFNRRNRLKETTTFSYTYH